jgi:hypothetical protein
MEFATVIQRIKLREQLHQIFIHCTTFVLANSIGSFLWGRMFWLPRYILARFLKEKWLNALPGTFQKRIWAGAWMQTSLTTRLTQSFLRGMKGKGIIAGLAAFSWISKPP